MKIMKKFCIIFYERLLAEFNNYLKCDYLKITINYEMFYD